MRCLAQQNKQGYLYSYNPGSKKDIKIALDIVKHCLNKGIRFQMIKEAKNKGKTA